MTRLRYFIPVLLLAALALLAAGPAAAQTEPNAPTDDQVNAIAKELYCPVCENIPLDVCGTQACAQWRDLIRLKLSEGWSEAQIKQYFVDQYGDRVIGVPPARGLNWLVYIVPPIAILAGAFILLRALRAWRAIPAEAPAAPPAQADDYIARLEEELKKR
jgi:cytochrome c-type biogenesis protein CcmH